MSYYINGMNVDLNMIYTTCIRVCVFWPITPQTVYFLTILFRKELTCFCLWYTHFSHRLPICVMF